MSAGTIVRGNPDYDRTVSPSPKFTPLILSGDSVEVAGADGKRHEETTEGREITTEEEEVEPRKVVRTPYTPSASQVAEHRVDHCPCRDWCEECREAFGREAPHSSVEHQAQWVPVISCDYLFLSARGVFLRNKWEPMEGKSFLKTPVITDSRGHCRFANAVASKGTDEAGYAVECFATDVAWLGWSRVIVRSDNEPALAKLVVEALKEIKVNGIDQASAEGSIPYDPRAMGRRRRL